jgi:spermidine/putrescine transport system permease protein
MSRLQRQDRFQEEAAMDLGASPLLLFWRITIPFLRPAIITSAALAFLMSFENYNTTVFSIGSNCTVTTEIAQQARKAHTPVINALGFIFVSLTIFGALIYTFFHRRRFSRN